MGTLYGKKLESKDSKKAGGGGGGGGGGQVLKDLGV